MTIHAYSSDHKERVRVLLVAGFASILLAWILHLALRLMPFSVPWWVDTPSVLGFFALFDNLFDRRFWRVDFIRKILGLNTPDLNGHWKGQLLSSYDDHSSPVDVELTVFQTWTNILITLETDSSISQSRTAGFVVEQPGRMRFIYEYLCEPKTTASSTMHTHHGTSELRVDIDNAELEGEYYTGRDRRTFGTIKLQKNRSPMRK